MRVRSATPSCDQMRSRKASIAAWSVSAIFGVISAAAACIVRCLRLWDPYASGMVCRCAPVADASDRIRTDVAPRLGGPLSTALAADCGAGLRRVPAGRVMDADHVRLSIRGWPALRSGPSGMGDTPRPADRIACDHCGILRDLVGTCRPDHRHARVEAEAAARGWQQDRCPAGTGALFPCAAIAGGRGDRFLVGAVRCAEPHAARSDLQDGDGSPQLTSSSPECRLYTRLKYHTAAAISSSAGVRFAASAGTPNTVPRPITACCRKYQPSASSRPTNSRRPSPPERSAPNANGSAHITSTSVFNGYSARVQNALR